jgi:hypothetical protein
MSSPKEKAEELYCKYDSLFKAPFKKHQQIKECALVAVNEIIEEVVNSADLDYLTSRVFYWEQVKKEIEKL